MGNLIDELQNDHIKCCKVLDLLTNQLNKIHNGKSADFYLMLDAIRYLEYYSEFALAPKEDFIFKESAKNKTNARKILEQYHSEYFELSKLIHKLHDFINAALEDSIVEKEPFEQQLETCIQRQREHIDTEENVIFPYLRETIPEKELRKITMDFRSQTNATNADELFCKYDDLYHRIIQSEESKSHKIH